MGHRNLPINVMNYWIIFTELFFFKYVIHFGVEKSWFNKLKDVFPQLPHAEHDGVRKKCYN